MRGKRLQGLLLGAASAGLRGLKEDAINNLGAIDPPRSCGGAITLPDATTDYTAATGA